MKLPEAIEKAKKDHTLFILPPWNRHIEPPACVISRFYKGEWQTIGGNGITFLESFAILEEGNDEYMQTASQFLGQKLNIHDQDLMSDKWSLIRIDLTASYYIVEP